MSPAASKKQRRFMGAELARVREGKPAKLGLAEATLADFAGTPEKDLPMRAPKPKAKAKKR